LKAERVIVVTGTPGVGKTVFSRALAEKLNATYVNVGEVALKKGFIKGVDRERETRIADIKKLKAWMREFTNKTRGIIVVDGHYAPALIPKREVKKIFVLRCHPLILKERLRKKGASKREVMENVTAELLDVCLIDALKECGNPNKIYELEATNRNVRELVDEALKALEKDEKSFGSIDWISRLSEEKTLSKALYTSNKEVK